MRKSFVVTVSFVLSLALIAFAAGTASAQEAATQQKATRVYVDTEGVYYRMSPPKPAMKAARANDKSATVNVNPVELTANFFLVPDPPTQASDGSLEYSGQFIIGADVQPQTPITTPLTMRLSGEIAGEMNLAWATSGGFIFSGGYYGLVVPPVYIRGEQQFSITASVDGVPVRRSGGLLSPQLMNIAACVNTIPGQPDTVAVYFSMIGYDPAYRPENSYLFKNGGYSGSLLFGYVDGVHLTDPAVLYVQINTSDYDASFAGAWPFQFQVLQKYWSPANWYTVFPARSSLGNCKG